jgi:hypothetical protein
MIFGFDIKIFLERNRCFCRVSELNVYRYRQKAQKPQHFDEVERARSLFLFLLLFFFFFL